MFSCVSPRKRPLLCAGVPGQAVGLDFNGTLGTWALGVNGTLEFRDLVLYGLPLGLPEQYPLGLLTSLLWFVNTSGL